MKHKLKIRVFTDPLCPFAYSAEPLRLRLSWLYGDQIEWSDSMIVLSGYQGEVSSLSTEQVAQYRQEIGESMACP